MRVFHRTKMLAALALVGTVVGCAGSPDQTASGGGYTVTDSGAE